MHTLGGARVTTAAREAPRMRRTRRIPTAGQPIDPSKPRSGSVVTVLAFKA